MTSIDDVIIPEIPSFHWVDILLFCVYLLLVAGMGVYIGWKGRTKATTKEFLMGGGDLHFFPVALSLMASFLSAIFILGTSSEMYFFGTTYCYIGISYFIGIPIAAHMYLPIYHRLKVTSAYEYLEIRFNKVVRIVASLTFALMVLLYLSVVLYTPSMAMAQVTGLNMVGSILATGLICTFYTALGGMKATVWNDAIQMLVVLTCIILMLILGLIDVGGISKVWEISDEGGRIIWDNFDPDPTTRYTFWTQTIGGIFTNAVMYASAQTIAQKFLSVRTVRQGQIACWTAAGFTFLFMVILAIVGLVIYAYYVGCDPYTLGRIEQIDQILPLYVMEVFGELPGLPGLFIAAIFSAALSSISGSLNALAGVIITDFVRPYYAYKGKKIKEKTANIVSRCIATFFGLLVIGTSFLAEYMGDTVIQIAVGIFGFVGGPLLAVITLGIFMPCVNTWGALTGLFTSLLICSWMAIGNILYNAPSELLPLSIEDCDYINRTLNHTETMSTFSWVDASTSASGAGDNGEDSIMYLYRVSSMWYGLIALVVAVVVAIPVSIITGWNKKQEVDPRLIYSCADKCCCYCPESCKSCFRCGVEKFDEDNYPDKDEIITKADIIEVTADSKVGFDNMAHNHQDEKTDKTDNFDHLDNIPEEQNIQQDQQTNTKEDLLKHSDSDPSSQDTENTWL